VNTENFKQFFEQFGEVIDSIVMIDRGTDRHRGFGFVTFKNPNVAKNVLSKGNEGKPVPKGGWKQGHLDIFGKMCEVKVCEPKKELVGNRMNERHSKNRSSSSSETYAGLIPSNIQILAGHQNVHDVQYGLESSIIPPSLPYVMYPPVVQGPHAGGLSLRHDNSIQLYDYSYAGGMYEHYPESYYQGVYHHYYNMPPEGSYDYGYPDFYLGMQPQYPTLPGMALPTYSNEESVPCADFGDTPTLTRERQGKQAEK
jgi:RNA recognition motif-containing protein